MIRHEPVFCPARWRPNSSLRCHGAMPRGCSQTPDRLRASDTCRSVTRAGPSRGASPAAAGVWRALPGPSGNGQVRDQSLLRRSPVTSVRGCSAWGAFLGAAVGTGHGDTADPSETQSLVRRVRRNHDNKIRARWSGGRARTDAGPPSVPSIRVGRGCSGGDRRRGRCVRVGVGIQGFELDGSE
jgi:hypothetical protein